MLLDIFDPKAAPRAIGIDLGTTHSIVACVRDGRPYALTTCDGTPLLPSVVHYGDHNSVLVGAAAKAFATRDPERTIASVKRFMGRGAGDAETERLGTLRFVAPKGPEDANVVRFDLGARVVTPVEVSAEILKSLKQSALDQLVSVGAAVITVPAYFDDAQRQATKDAARLAQLDVLRLLNEPTAAALAYGLDKKRDGTFVVYDLGGGTFDVTVLVLDDGVFQVKSTGGDSALGGDDMDRLIAERMLDAMGCPFGPRRTPEIVSLALEAARSAKHGLSDVLNVEVELPKFGGGQVLFALSRAELEQMIALLMERTGRACRRALRDAGLAAADIDGVILVGGTTRMPRVKAYVAEMFGQQPLGDIDPDLVVAYGAAAQAELLANASDDVLLLDVLPLSLGIETMGGGVDRVLPRNTTLPAGAKSVFTTYADNQTGFEIHVVQGERELAADCRSLARFTLGGIPPLPAGMARLEVHFDVDENNLLRVEATELTTGLRQTVEVRPSYGLSDEQIEEMLIEALDHGEADLERRRLADARVEGERIALATEKGLRADADLLTPEGKADVERVLAQLRQALRSAERATPIQRCIEDLDAATHAWAGLRMNRAISTAIAGKNLGQVEATVSSALGVDAHVEAHARAQASKSTHSAVATFDDVATLDDVASFDAVATHGAGKSIDAGSPFVAVPAPVEKP